jgi:hypothetical protein
LCQACALLILTGIGSIITILLLMLAGFGKVFKLEICPHISPVVGRVDKRSASTLQNPASM